MYVTRPLSLYKRNPSALSSPPPEGPNSGILIIQDEEAQPTCCFGLFKSDQVKDLPFPQNKNLRPLSSNQYYVIDRRGRHKGKVHTNATEDDVATCCFGCCIPDMEPVPFDPKDESGVVPFMFIKEGKLKDQLTVSRYYEMTLEQRWEQIFACENGLSGGNSVIVDAAVQREVIAVAGREVKPAERNVVDGIMWFRSSSNAGGEESVGLGLEIVDRMKWEQERAGWVGGDESYVTVKRVEEVGGIGGWKKLGCYVLVERFVLRRMDGSLVLTHDFKHTQQIRSKWE
ncbi:hypothetical protein OIU85_006107 [Salix viminalis]|uniref:Uncharacterized protein n=1 Tax=Salix viminalis TaxID=40686 RepID=A0A9Q0PKZ8_SALVM|nr:hypothetical protein OIU85_006107 [Salix viminalis]